MQTFVYKRREGLFVYTCDVWFLQRSAILCAVLVILSCLSVCPSHAGIVSKRMNIGWCRLHWRVAQCI